MSKHLSFLAAGLIVWLQVASAHAVVLSLIPDSTDAAPGDLVSLDLVIDGLGAGAPDSLGAYDVDIVYDPAAVSVFSVALDNAWAGVSIDLGFGDLGGVIDLAVLSLESVVFLDAIQGASFTLATIDFMVDVLAEGASTVVGIDALDPFLVVSDGLGDELAIDDLRSATLTNPRDVPTLPVPEPGSVPLLLLGLGAVVWIKRRAGAPFRQ